MRAAEGMLTHSVIMIPNKHAAHLTAISFVSSILRAAHLVDGHLDGDARQGALPPAAGCCCQRRNPDLLGNTLQSMCPEQGIQQGGCLQL